MQEQAYVGLADEVWGIGQDADLAGLHVAEGYDDTLLYSSLAVQDSGAGSIGADEGQRGSGG